MPAVIPGKGKIYSLALQIPEDVIKRVYEGTAFLYFYGWAKYRDVFEGTPEHRTEFCYNVEILQMAGDKVSTNVKFHHQHNTND